MNYKILIRSENIKGPDLIRKLSNESLCTSISLIVKSFFPDSISFAKVSQVSLYPIEISLIISILELTSKQVLFYK